MTRSQVEDNERTLKFQVASLFINVQLAESTLDLTQQNLTSYQKTVDLSETQFKGGAISENDYLKIKLQLLQFQTDLQQAQLSRVQALSDLRQQLGYENRTGRLRLSRAASTTSRWLSHSKNCRRKLCRTGRICAPRNRV